MKNPLHKRYIRELKDDFGKYVVICILLVISIGFLSGFEVADGSLIKAYNASFEKYNVEDGNFTTERTITASQKTILEKNGIIVDCVGDGVQALESFEKSSLGYYAMILMDILMPRMNGLEATRRIRTLQRKDASLIPIIAMSANAFSDDIMRGKMAGMNEYLAKPLDEEMLIRAIRKCLK